MNREYTLSSEERSLIMQGVEARWRNMARWGMTGFDYESAWSLFTRLGASISGEFHDALKERIDGEDRS